MKVVLCDTYLYLDVNSEICTSFRESQVGVNWELGFAFLLTGKTEFDFFGLGFGSEKVFWMFKEDR